ncbi:hypothetical protein K469DRAFT_700907 [Zopfia rhizophila CBS 207.26]|uniref:Zn(2)-C6 fungal-type domain-containing protein n=1 Tax=Zopfia rhizophila CBS 207.26 TaxID=1314779 RepID=A0A6A6ECT7_9PEZI|nr:hypothetical protein K469DRAFT_700907 [Zopfia rhizophila CBS 207.26]
MPSRKTHNKTRLGCGQCKKRRIKCDEKHPVCNNCSKRGLECSFLLLIPSSRLSSSSPPTEVTVTQKRQYDVHVFHPESSNPVPVYVPPYPKLPMLQIRLDDVWKDCRDLVDPQFHNILNHYDTHTCLTLASDDPAKATWQSVVPEMAFTHRFLVHGVIAIASLHLARLHKGKAEQDAMLNIAYDQMNQTLYYYRKALQNVNPNNASALFACSTLTAVYFFHNSASDFEEIRSYIPAETLVPPPDVVDQMIHSIMKTFHGLRGTLIILRPGWNWVVEGKLSPICTRSWWPKNPTPATERAMDEDRRLCKLEGLWMQPGRNYEAYFDDLAESLKILREIFALVSQLTLPNRTHSPNCAVPYSADDTTVGMLMDRGAIFSWPARVPKQFLTLVEQKNCEALVILAHFAVLPGRIRNVWWLDGLGVNIITAAAMGLGQGNWSLIEWPAQVVGVDLANAFGSGLPGESSDVVPVNPHLRIV